MSRALAREYFQTLLPPRDGEDANEANGTAILFPKLRSRSMYILLLETDTRPSSKDRISIDAPSLTQMTSNLYALFMFNITLRDVITLDIRDVKMTRGELTRLWEILSSEGALTHLSLSFLSGGPRRIVFLEPPTATDPDLSKIHNLTLTGCPPKVCEWILLTFRLPNLKTLHLDQCCIDPTPLGESLQSCLSIRSLLLTNNKFASISLDSLRPLLRGVPFLEELALDLNSEPYQGQHNDILSMFSPEHGDHGVRMPCPQLQRLDLDHVVFDPAHVLSILSSRCLPSAALGQHRRLQHLRIFSPVFRTFILFTRRPPNGGYAAMFETSEVEELEELVGMMKTGDVFIEQRDRPTIRIQRGW